MFAPIPLSLGGDLAAPMEDHPGAIPNGIFIGLLYNCQGYSVRISFIMEKRNIVAMIFSNLFLFWFNRYVFIIVINRYVVNGANVGNAILKFDLEGNFLGEVCFQSVLIQPTKQTNKISKLISEVCLPQFCCQHVVLWKIVKTLKKTFQFWSQYPGWFNFPIDLVVGGAGQDQVRKQQTKNKQTKKDNKQTNK